MSVKITAETPVADWVKNSPKVKLCAGHCNRYTRNASMTVEELPGTVARSSEGKCQKCLNDERRADPATKAQASDSLQHTITGLEQFMARRRERLSPSIYGVEQFRPVRLGRSL